MKEINILINIFPDDNFFLTQRKLFLWIKTKGFVTWKQIQKTCIDLIAAFPEEYILKYGKFPEYKLFMPLLRNGFCEIASNGGKSGFVAVIDDEKRKKIDPVFLLNNIPSLFDIVSCYKKEDSIELNVLCDLNDKYQYKIIDNKIHDIGIYKSEDKVYQPAYLFDGKEIRQIPDYEENLDAINIARCFVRSYKNQVIFVYHQKSKTLNTSLYSELPILVSRALYLLCEDNLNDKKCLYPIGSDFPYKNVGLKVVNELMRIFGEKTVEVRND
ncbi:hypothetical protein [uncultured Treponema sp.]|uniref:hypothetical protein n=1 Tax=uncultured Treponema sp. TaxID=162155 RepID=UPI0027D9CC21|nr:hypothetical protein [uncultured Treponema sp.]